MMTHMEPIRVATLSVTDSKNVFVPDGTCYGTDRDEMLVDAYERAFSRRFGLRAPRLTLDGWRQASQSEYKELMPRS